MSFVLKRKNHHQPTPSCTTRSCVSIRLKQIFTFVAIFSPKINSIVKNWLKMNDISEIEILKYN